MNYMILNKLDNLYKIILYHRLDIKHVKIINNHIRLIN